MFGCIKEVCYFCDLVKEFVEVRVSWVGISIDFV